MKALVVALAILAGMKMWTQQTLFRAASEQALLKAYGSEAISMCEKTTAKDGDHIPNLRKTIDWTNPWSAKLVIGDQTVDVALWQVDHKDWDQRFKTPYIHLKTGATSKPHVCVFNVMTGRASILRA